MRKLFKDCGRMLSLAPDNRQVPSNMTSDGLWDYGVVNCMDGWVGRERNGFMINLQSRQDTTRMTCHGSRDRNQQEQDYVKKGRTMNDLHHGFGGVGNAG